MKFLRNIDITEDIPLLFSEIIEYSILSVGRDLDRDVMMTLL